MKDSPLASLVASGVKSMDSANFEAAKVLADGGHDAFMKHVFTDKETGKQLS